MLRIGVIYLYGLFIITLLTGCSKKHVTIKGYAYDDETGLPLENFSVVAGRTMSQSKKELKSDEVFTKGDGYFEFKRLVYSINDASINLYTKDEDYFKVTYIHNISKHTHNINQDVYFKCKTKVSFNVFVNTSIVYTTGLITSSVYDNSGVHNFDFDNSNSFNYAANLNFQYQFPSGNQYKSIVNVKLYNLSALVKEKQDTLTGLSCKLPTNYTMSIN